MPTIPKMTGPGSGSGFAAALIDGVALAVWWGRTRGFR
jgi:hypothetical protein